MKYKEFKKLLLLVAASSYKGEKETEYLSIFRYLSKLDDQFCMKYEEEIEYIDIFLETEIEIELRIKGKEE